MSILQLFRHKDKSKVKREWSLADDLNIRANYAIENWLNEVNHDPVFITYEEYGEFLKLQPFLSFTLYQAMREIRPDWVGTWKGIPVVIRMVNHE